jgi:hypothetical protein
LAHLGWRLAYYGAPLPNTYYAKTGGGPALWAQGLDGLGRFVSSAAHLPWLVAAAAGALLGARRGERTRTAAVMSAAVILQIAWIVSVGDDGLRVHRFYVPLLAPLAVLTALLFRRDAPASRGAAGVGLAAVATAASLFTLHTDFLPAMRQAMLVYQEGNAKLGRWLSVHGPADGTIAVAAAGALPYYSRLATIDMYGLNDAHIARGPFPDAPGRLMKWDNAYVLSRRPDLIVPNLGYVPAGDAPPHEIPRRPRLLVSAPMDEDLFRRLRDERAYLLRPLDLGDGSVFWVFERKRA